MPKHKLELRPTARPCDLGILLVDRPCTHAWTVRTTASPDERVVAAKRPEHKTCAEPGLTKRSSEEQDLKEL